MRNLGSMNILWPPELQRPWKTANRTFFSKSTVDNSSFDMNPSFSSASASDAITNSFGLSDEP